MSKEILTDLFRLSDHSLLLAVDVDIEFVGATSMSPRKSKCLTLLC